MTGKPATPGRLLAVLGTAFGISVAIGNTIGSGILGTPGEIASLLGDARLFLLVWIAGALYAALGANMFAELASMTPESGGHTVYVRRGLGRYAGFVVGWSDWLSTCGTISIAAFVIGEAAQAVIGRPALTGSVVIGVLALIQLRGVETAGRAQVITAVIKTVAFLVLVIACFTISAHPASASPPGTGSPLVARPHGAALAFALVIAMRSVIFTYDGYYGAMYFGGEMKNPGRDIPRAIFGGVLAVAAVYLLVNLAFLHVLGVQRMAHVTLVAVAAAMAIFGPRGAIVVNVLVIVSLLSAVNAFQLMASRILYRLGRRGIVSAASSVNAGGTPMVSLLISALTSLAFLWTGTFETVVGLTAFFFVAQYTLDFASLLVLRKREPDAPRPFRARGHPWTTWGVLLLSIAFLAGAVAADTRNSLYSLLLLAASYPIFLLLDRGKDRTGAEEY